MLRVLCRGSMDNPKSWYKGKADFIQNNQTLAMVKQAFAKFFYQLPVGISISPERNNLMIPFCAAVSLWPVVKKVTVEVQFIDCFCTSSCKTQCILKIGQRVSNLLHLMRTVKLYGKGILVARTRAELNADPAYLEASRNSLLNNDELLRQKMNQFTRQALVETNIGPSNFAFQTSINYV